MSSPDPVRYLEDTLARAFPAESWRDIRVLLAVSGGADSTALLQGMARFPKLGTARLMVAHIHHGLRVTADADAQFVECLANEHGLTYFVRQADVSKLAQQMGDGIEAAARESRYRLLTEIAEEQGCRYVLTGHTADDQVETILHQIVRGCGMTGLQGMPKTRALSAAVTLLRPLLEVRRHAIQDYLTTLAQSWRDDESNRSARFTRNRIRHEILPLLRSINPRLEVALLSLAKQATDTLECLATPIAELCRTATLPSPAGEMICDTATLAAAPPQVLRLALLKMWKDLNWPLQNLGREELCQLAQLIADRQSARLNYPGNVDVVLTADKLRLTRHASSE